MTDKSFDSADSDRRGVMLGEAIDGAVRKIATALVIAGAVVGLAIYARPGPARFDAFAFGDQIVRVDGRTGTIIACRGTETCRLILRKGQRLDRIKRSDALPSPPALPRLPAAPASEK